MNIKKIIEEKCRNDRNNNGMKTHCKDNWFLLAKEFTITDSSLVIEYFVGSSRSRGCCFIGRLILPAKMDEFIYANPIVIMDWLNRKIIVPVFDEYGALFQASVEYNHILQFVLDNGDNS